MSKTKTEHGNVGKRNAAKADPKSSRIGFRCLPEIEELAKIQAEEKGVSLADYLTDLIKKQSKKQKS